MQGISIVTGTLNRREYLKDLLRDTVESDERLELVLVDGGSTDGTIETLEDINHPRVKLVKHGERSSYPHYMNLGIHNSSYELVCQWNDDVLLANSWDDVFNTIDEHDAYLFNWKEGSSYDTEDESWLKCNHIRDNGWNLHNCADYSYPNPVRGEIVMNYGIYKKNVFRKHGLYNDEYNYYCADGEMSMRAYYGGAKFKTCIDIKVCVLPAEKRAILVNEDLTLYTKHCTYYTLPRSITGCSIGEIFNGEYL
jgi:glycosyltransferase involved in cell wall biosynthesis|tara:strand:+ start:1508 stop:2263 length:756 start_codon:yes stop_codon:yes gene_type:complete